MSEQKGRWWLVTVLVGVVTFAVIMALALQRTSGIRVSVENTGTSPLNQVVLHVTGASYNVGDVAPGSSAAARVRPSSESHLEIEYVDDDGNVQRLNAGGYFEPGYRGTIRVSVTDGVIDVNEQDIELW